MSINFLYFRQGEFPFLPGVKLQGLRELRVVVVVVAVVVVFVLLRLVLLLVMWCFFALP